LVQGFCWFVFPPGPLIVWAGAAHAARRPARVLSALAATLVWAVVVTALVTAHGTTPAATSSRPAAAAHPTAPQPTAAPAPAPGSRPTGPEGAGLAALHQLTVAPPDPMAGYSRGLFHHWIDADHDGCDTRCEVLRAQRWTTLPGLHSGGWLSMYDGYTTDDPSELDIDHVVALGEAWVSGADRWDAAPRTEYANDLTNLVAVSAAMNRSKGDRDPDMWQPPNRAAWCEFATIWTVTKARYGLTADPAEVGALTNMLVGCP
jgi:hypothetical protein